VSEMRRSASKAYRRVGRKCVPAKDLFCIEKKRVGSGTDREEIHDLPGQKGTKKNSSSAFLEEDRKPSIKVPQGGLSIDSERVRYSIKKRTKGDYDQAPHGRKALLEGPRKKGVRKHIIQKNRRGKLQPLNPCSDQRAGTRSRV